MKTLNKLLLGIMAVLTLCLMLPATSYAYPDGSWSNGKTDGAGGASGKGSGVSGHFGDFGEGYRLTFVETSTGRRVAGTKSLDIVNQKPSKAQFVCLKSVGDDWENASQGNDVIFALYSDVQSRMNKWAPGADNHIESWYHGYGNGSGQYMLDYIQGDTATQYLTTGAVSAATLLLSGYTEAEIEQLYPGAMEEFRKAVAGNAFTDVSAFGQFNYNMAHMNNERGAASDAVFQAVANYAGVSLMDVYAYLGDSMMQEWMSGQSLEYNNWKQTLGKYGVTEEKTNHLTDQLINKISQEKYEKIASFNGLSFRGESITIDDFGIQLSGFVIQETAGKLTGAKKTSLVPEQQTSSTASTTPGTTGNTGAGTSPAAERISELDALRGSSDYDVTKYGRVYPLIMSYGFGKAPDSAEAKALAERYFSNEITLVVEATACARMAEEGTGKASPFIYGTFRNWTAMVAAGKVNGVITFSNNVNHLHNYQDTNGSHPSIFQLAANEDEAVMIDGNKVRNPLQINGLSGVAGDEFYSPFGKHNHTLSYGKMWSLKDTPAGVAFALFAANSSKEQVIPPTTPTTTGGGGGYRIIKYYQKTTLFGAIPMYYSNYTTSIPAVKLEDEDVNGTGFKYIGYYTVGYDYNPVKPTCWDKSVQENTGKMLRGGADPGTIDFSDGGGKTVVILYEYDSPGGLGIHTYNVDKLPKTPDPPQNPKTPNPLRDDPQKYPPGTEQNNFSIVKIYRTKQADGTFQHKYYFVERDVPHTITIMNEKNKTDEGWTLKQWFTSKNDFLPTLGRDPENYKWEPMKSSYGGSYGSTPEGVPYQYTLTQTEFQNGDYKKQIIIPPSQGFKSLWLLYELEGKQVQKVIIKKNEDGTIAGTEGPSIIPEDQYKGFTVPDYPAYEYEETDFSPLDPTPNNPNGTPTTDRVFDINPNTTKTIYIIYKPATKHITLYSDQLSRGDYTLKSLSNSGQLYIMYDKAAALSSQHDVSRHYHCTWYHHSSSCSGHTCYAKGAKFEKKTFSMSVDNSNYDYNSGTSFIRDLNLEGILERTWVAQKTAEKSGQSDPVKPQATYLFYRDKNRDLVTLYPNKNDTSLQTDLANIGIQWSAASYKGSTHRYKLAVDYAYEIIKNSFKTYFRYTSHDQTLTWRCDARKNGPCDTGSYSSEPVQTPDMANSFYNVTDNCWTYLYTGRPNTSTVKPQDTSAAKAQVNGDGFNNYTGGSKYPQYTFAVSEPVNFQFYPFIKMMYKPLHSSKVGGSEVCVTSSNISTMALFQTIQVGVISNAVNGKPNIMLESTMWNTHASTLQFLSKKSISDKNTVLPGGGIVELSMPKRVSTDADNTIVGIRTWTPFVPDDNPGAKTYSYSAASAIGGNYLGRLSEAKTVASKTFATAKSTIGGYGLQQHMTESFKNELDSVISGTDLPTSNSVSWLANSTKKLSVDSKYWLKHDSSGSDRDNFDVVTEGASGGNTGMKTQIAYVIGSDYNGVFTVTKTIISGSSAGSVTQKKVDARSFNIKVTSEAKRQQLAKKIVDAFKSNADLATLDDNSKLITNYVNALDLCNYTQYYSLDNNLYTEGFDGVGVLMTTYTIAVNFSGNLSSNMRRTCVVDPIVIAKAESKSDLYNYSDESKIRSSVYNTKAKSTTAKDSNGADVTSEGYLTEMPKISTLGTVKGTFKDIKHFAFTKIFWIGKFDVSSLS